jgi:serine/threonine protein kinase/tetratricopeptide (TPR) repeat protein
MSFRGTKRFELIRKLGEGGMGLVYEAHDNDRDMRVALKTLRDLDASSLYRFKREFRALTDVSHPNVIGLYELVSEGNDWFFTMELVEGVDFISYVRPAGWRSPEPAQPMLTTRPTARMEITPQKDVQDPTWKELAAPAPRAKVPLDAVVDLGRLRATLQQLAQALDSLHGANVVHRDLKPSNIRVTPKGRVVLMDFGIAAEASVLGDGADGAISGTPAFMAPEQAAGDTPTAAADWYAFGVVMYHALTGQLPFSGAPEVMLMAKQDAEAPAPSLLTDGIPPELDELCCKLMARRAEDRPPAAKVLAALGVQPTDPFRTEAVDSSRDVFVGRSNELDELRQAFETMTGGKTLCVFVRGVSGMGKSTLLRRFLTELSHDARQPIVLKGRCHERESLPYKAFDGVIDSLSHVLLAMTAERAQALLPDEVDLLPRLFPVLRRVPGIQRARPLGLTDPQELRARAFAALSELLSRLARYRPVVVYIDDLQWADRDSLQLLVELMRDPDAPRLLFVGSMRAENLATDPGLEAALKAVATHHAAKQLDVGPLSQTEQRALVERLLGDGAQENQLTDEFWAESSGSPLFLSELVRFAREHGGKIEGSGAAGKPRLEDVLYARIEKLPAQARTLIEVVAAAGEPLPLWVLGDAAALSGEERERALAMLRVGSLVRVARHGREPWLAAYHDRVRETLAARLPAERLRTLHQHLAEVLERWEDATVDALARHWLAAGDRRNAASYLVKAARSATEKLAFDRAAELLRAALECGGHSAAQVRELLRERGEALALAGRSFEAAGEFKKAAEGAPADEAVELTRKAADNLLRSGHIDAGLQALKDVMSRLGIRVADSRGRALASLVFQRLRIALRGLGFKPRRANEVAAGELARLDTLYAASTALGMIDHVRGADVQTRHLRTALDVGEEKSAWRALAIEAVFQSAQGGRHLKKAEKLSRETELQARRIGDPALMATSQLAVGAAFFFSGRYRGSALAFEEAERLFSAECRGVEWERVTARYFACYCRVAMGEFEEAGRTTERLTEEADRHNDIYARSLFRTFPNTWRLLVLDRPDEAIAQLAAALEGWPRDEFYMAHYLNMISRATIHVYLGEFKAALGWLRASLPSFKRSMLADLPWVMADFRRWIMHAAIMENDYSTVEHWMKPLASLNADLTDGYVALYRGALAHRRGDPVAGQRFVSEAIHLYEAADTPHIAAACRNQLGRVLGGVEGERLQAEAHAWMQARGVHNTARMLDLLVPRF